MTRFLTDVRIAALLEIVWNRDHCGAVALLADMDAEQWGEDERASRYLHGRRSFGLCVNAIVHYDGEAPSADLKKLASDVLTAEDWRALGQGG